VDQARFQPGAYLAPRYWPGWLALGLLRAAILMPYAWQCRLGRLLGMALYHLHRKRQRIAAANIDLCFPDLPQAQREELVKETFRHTGITVFETPLAWWGNTERLRGHCEIEGLHHLLEALEHGKGVILLTGHSTSLEMGGRLLSLYTPVQALYRTVRNKFVNAVTLQARSGFLERIILRTKLRAALRGLAENLSTWYAPDQDFGTRGTVFAEFLGTSAATLFAPAKLARLSGAKVVPFFPYRLPGDAGFKLVIEAALEDFPTGDDHRDARRVNEVLGRQILKAPAQYMWVHRRFKTRPPGEPEVY
jgi:KDO2-lipid IV(A) lauroyltransferase